MSWKKQTKRNILQHTLGKYTVAFFWLMLLSFLFICPVLQAQQPDRKIKKLFGEAESAYQQNHFSQAELYLAKILKRDAQFVKAYLLQGDIYASKHQTDSAVTRYRKGLYIDSVSWPAAFFVLAGWEYKAGDYTASQRDIQHFLRFGNKNSSRYQKALRLSKIATFATFSVAHPVKTKIEKLNAGINSSENEYINFVDAEQNQLFFTRKILTHQQGRPVYKEHFYQTLKKKNAWQLPKRIYFPWDSTRNTGALSLSTDGRNIYFTGCYWPDGMGSCDIYTSRKRGKYWQRPKHLDGNVNTSGWDSQAVVSSDNNRLFFASKRPGGMGGSDIWMCIRQKNGRWGKAINLGDSINTSGNEMAPFLHADGHTLYFSSNGHIGMGGYDLYVSREDSTGHWTKAVNLGFPVNTKANELNIFVSLDGRHAWISSDRDTINRSFDIYSFPVYSKIRPEKVLFVKGVIQDALSGKKLKATVILTNLNNGQIMDSIKSDGINGNFLMVLHEGTDYAFNIQKKGYLIYSQSFNLKTFPGLTSINKVFSLTPATKGAVMRLHNIRFEFDSSRLRPSAFSELEKLFRFLNNNPKIKILIAGYTDNVGNTGYNLKLSRERAAAVFQYLLSKGIDAGRMQYKGFGNTHPLSTNDTPQGRANNRRTEIIIK